MKILHLCVAILATLFISSNIATASEFYKWTDEKGVTHYSERKPVDQQAETISTKTKGKKPPTYIPFSDEAKAAAENTQQPSEEESSAAEQQTTTSDKQETAKAEEPVKQEIKADPAVCAQAKKDESILRSRPIVRQNGKVMTIEEKNKQLATLLEIQKVHCK